MGGGQTMITKTKIKKIKEISKYARENVAELNKIFNEHKYLKNKNDISIISLLLAHPEIQNGQKQEFCSDIDFLTTLAVSTDKSLFKEIEYSVQDILADNDVARCARHLLICIGDDALYRNFDKIKHKMIRNDTVKRYIRKGLNNKQTNTIPVLSKIDMTETLCFEKEDIAQNEHALIQIMIAPNLSEEYKRKIFDISGGINPDLLGEYLSKQNIDELEIPDFVIDEIYKSCVDVFFEKTHDVKREQMAYEILMKIPISKSASIDFVNRFHSEKKHTNGYTMDIYEKICETTDSIDAMTLILESGEPDSIKVLINNKNANKLENFQKYMDGKVQAFIYKRRELKKKHNEKNYQDILTIGEAEILTAIAKKKLIKNDDLLMDLINICDDDDVAVELLNNVNIGNTNHYKKHYFGEVLPDVMVYTINKMQDLKFAGGYNTDKYVKSCILNTLSSINNCESNPFDMSRMPVTKDRKIYEKIIAFADSLKAGWEKDRLMHTEIEIETYKNNKPSQIVKEIDDIFDMLKKAAVYEKIKCDIANCLPGVISVERIQGNKYDNGQELEYSVKIENFKEAQQETVKKEIKNICDENDEKYIVTFFDLLKKEFAYDSTEKQHPTPKGINDLYQNIYYANELYDLYQKAYDIIIKEENEYNNRCTKGKEEINL